MLMRLAYLGVANVFALLRLLPMSSRDRDAEILALRRQLMVLQRQFGPDKVRFTPADRALLAALLHRLPRDVLRRLHLVGFARACSSSILASSPTRIRQAPDRTPSRMMVAACAAVNP